MSKLGLSGDPRPILTDFILANYPKDAIHYIQNTDELEIQYGCFPSKKNPDSLSRAIILPSKTQERIIEKRITESNQDFILFHITLNQKDVCTNPTDNRRHGLMLLYNRKTKYIYTYDILRYHYKGFRANILNKKIKAKFIPWLEELEEINRTIKESGSNSSSNSDYSIKTAEVNIKDTSSLVIDFLTEKYGSKPNATEWYPLLVLWEIDTLFLASEQTPEDVTNFMLEINQEDRHEILNMLYNKFQKFTEDIYSIYHAKCENLENTIYDPELQSCVTKNSSKSKSTSKSSIDILDIGLVDSPKHNRFKMGNEYAQVIMMRYFSDKYPKMNSFTPKKTKWNIRKNDYTILWEFDIPTNKWVLTIPKTLPRFLKTTVGNPAYDYASFLIRLKSKPKDDEHIGYHLNSIIYNRETNEIEHFEPHGSRLSAFYEPTELYKQMAKFIQKYMPNTKYIIPSEFCMSKQFFQTIEGDEMGFTNEYGMCAAWTLWYIELRLANPTLSRDNVVKKALKQLNKIGSFRTFIRNYEKYYMHMINDIVEKHYLDNKKVPLKISFEPESYFVS